MVKAGRSSRNAQGKKDDKMHSGAGRSSPEDEMPRIDPRVQREIGKHLRAHYDDVINEPVPEKFIELLKELERSVKRRS